MDSRTISTDRGVTNAGTATAVSDSHPASLPDPSSTPTSSTITNSTPVPPSIPASTQPSSIVKKPEWATGDPFFDTMAGMDSSEYQSYYMPDASTGSQGPHQQGSLNVGINSMTISEGDSLLTSGPASAAGSSSSEIPSTSGSSANISNTGLDHWNRTREQWTKGQWHIVPSENSNNPALSAIHPGNHDAIYDSLVYDRKRLSKPIPLPLVIQILVSGWKRDGLWQESPIQPQPAPGSAPTSHGINAYVPGFSSTNSQPLHKKS